MQRSRLKNIINKSKTISGKQEIGNSFELFKKSLPIEIDGNYRLETAWKAYGKPSDYKSAIWEGLIEPETDGTFKLPSIGYNEETDEYEYLNSGKDNEIVAKDIRVWDNDVIPLVQELKLGGYVRLFNEEKNCWTYTKNSQKRELPVENDELQVIELFKSGGKPSNKKHWKKPENWADEKIPYEEWVKDINKAYLNDNYDLKTAYKSDMPKEELERWKWAVNSDDPEYYMNYLDKDGKYIYHLGSIAPIENGNYVFLKKGREENNPELHYETDAYWSGENGLRDTHNLVFSGDRYYYMKRVPDYKGKPLEFKQGGKSEYKKVKSDRAYYDKKTDTVYYTNDEDLVHEGFHARPDSILLEQLKPYYENLNDEKILNFGGNLLFVKRFEGDPGHFYSPEELGARIAAAKFRTKDNNYTPEFFKYLRTNENLYGDNMRDLLYMYNDENLSKIFNVGNTQAFKQGGQMNVIPEGALHARKNNMEGAGKDFTAKGIPVVDNDGEQQAEIEKEEIIFTKDLTEFIENNFKKFNSDEISNSDKDEIAIKVGKRLVKEILTNTDDKTGLIGEVELKM